MGKCEMKSWSPGQQTYGLAVLVAGKMGREKEYWLEKEKQRERNREKERKGKCPPSLFPSILSFKFVQRTKLKDWNIQLGETHTSIFGRQFKENLLSFQSFGGFTPWVAKHENPTFKNMLIWKVAMGFSASVRTVNDLIRTRIITSKREKWIIKEHVLYIQVLNSAWRLACQPCRKSRSCQFQILKFSEFRFLLKSSRIMLIFA